VVVVDRLQTAVVAAWVVAVAEAEENRLKLQWPEGVSAAPELACLLEVSVVAEAIRTSSSFDPAAGRSWRNPLMLQHLWFYCTLVEYLIIMLVTNRWQFQYSDVYCTMHFIWFMRKS
jgi:hypothetical protein